MTKKNFKTNALRLLDRNKIQYEIKEYEYDESDLSGKHVASMVDLDANQIYKTLVLQSNDNSYLVACIPVMEELDLKVLASIANYKSVQLIPLNELLNLTGYIRGGCSPIGMKKDFPLYIHEEILNYQQVAFSAGKRGYQMLVNPQDIINLRNAKIADLIRKK